MNGSTGGPVASLSASMLERIIPTRADRYTDRTFEAFKASDGIDPRWNATSLGPVEGADLSDAVTLALGTIGITFDHKDHLLIRETFPAIDGSQRIVLHIYAVKRKSAPSYVWRGHQQVRVNQLYPAHLFSMDAAVLA